MKLRISSLSNSEREEFLNQAKELLSKTQGTLRLSKVDEDKSKEKVLYLRERTLGEFLLENLIRTPQQIEDMQNEALAAIEFAFFSLDEMAGERIGNVLRASKENAGSCLDGFSNRIVPGNSKTENNERPFDDMNTGLCKEYLKWRVLGKKEPESETQIAQPGNAMTFNGLFAVPEGVSVSTCPALQVIAHNVVVSSCNPERVRKVERFSPLERALEEFKVGWRALRRKSSVSSGTCYKMPIAPGLRHIQNLFCLADDINRPERNVLANQNEEFWEKFYMSACQSLTGSIVMELYPDFYKSDERSGAKVPHYSEMNIKGAVDAAFKLRLKKGSGGQKPISFMFAVADETVAKAIKKELDARALNLPNGISQKKIGPVLQNADKKESVVACSEIESRPADNQAEEERGGRYASPERKMVMAELFKLSKARKKKELQRISQKLSKLSKEDLAEVLEEQDGDKLYDALEIIIETQPKPPRPIIPEDIPSPQDMALDAVVQKALSEYKRNRLEVPQLNLVTDAS